jgi:hypothetical protein
MDDHNLLVQDIKRLEKIARRHDIRINANYVTKIHSHTFLRQKPTPVLRRHKKRLEDRIAKTSRLRPIRTEVPVYQEEPSPLYTADWLTVVGALAQMAKESPQACVIALGLGKPGQNMRPGLLWVVAPNRTTKLVNKKSFESMFRTCQRRKGTQFILGLLGLKSQRCPSSSHFFSYVYDVNQNEMEVFDPNGGLQFQKKYDSTMYADFLDKYYQLDQFDKQAQNYLKSKLGISNVYMGTQWCPVGIQEIEQQDKPEGYTDKERDFGGYCAVWSIWWLQQRLKFPDMDRGALLTRLAKEFVDQKVSLKKYIQNFAQKLSKTKVQLMRTALRLGGKTPAQIDYMIKMYSQVETKCTEASNLLYHLSKESGPHDLNAVNERTKLICAYTKQYTVPILAEVSANLEPAVRLYSNGKIALSQQHRK